MTTTTTNTTSTTTMTTKRILLCRLSMYLNVKYQSNERRRIGLYRIFILRTSCLGFISFLVPSVGRSFACSLSVIFYSASTNAHSLHTVLFLLLLFLLWVCSLVLLLLVFTSFFFSFCSLTLALALRSAIGHGTVFFICTIHFPHWFEWKKKRKNPHTHIGQWCTVLLDIWCRRVIPLRN